MTKHFCRGSFCGPSGPWGWPQVDGLTTRSRFRSAVVAVLLLCVVASPVPPVVPLAEGQTGRIELHTLQTVTLTGSHFLSGAKDGESAIIAAELRLPRGAADDWMPVEPCRQYVARLHRLAKDVRLMEYPGAHHGFDMPWPLQHFSAYKGLGTCAVEERPDGKIVNRDTGQPWHPSDACTTDGVTAGADPRAYVEAVRAVKKFLIVTFKLSR
jgi:hypothetical protein